MRKIIFSKQPRIIFSFFQPFLDKNPLLLTPLVKKLDGTSSVFRKAFKFSDFEYSPLKYSALFSVDTLYSPFYPAKTLSNVASIYRGSENATGRQDEKDDCAPDNCY